MFRIARSPYRECVVIRAESYMMFAGARIRRGREKLGLTQEQFASKTGHGSSRAIARIEAGLTDMSITSMVRISGFLGIPPSTLLVPTEPLDRRAGRPSKRKASAKR